MIVRADHLRPLERVILRLHHEAVPAVEISRRLGKKPGTVNRILQMIDFKQGRDLKPAGRDGLRPIERVVLRLRAAGESYGEIGNRLGRSGAQIRRIEGYAHFKA